MRLEIPGFSEFYLETEDNRIYSKRYHPISEHINYGDHYHPVCELRLRTDQGDYKTVKKHRIVYMAYHPDEDISELQINHLDEDSLNNCPDNLVSCTAKENINWGTCLKRISESRKGVPNTKLAIPVKSIDINTNETNFYESMSEAGRQLNVSGSGISYACKNGNVFAGRYWEYYYGD